MCSPWSLYHKIIQPIPAIPVLEILQGEQWTMVRTVLGSGVALSDSSGRREKWESPFGRDLKELSQWVFSWDFRKASIGLAAINSFWNSTKVLTQNFGKNLLQLEPKQDIRGLLKSRYKNQKIASIGHFPFLDELGEELDISIVEINPRGNDFPASAAEFILPNMDLVLVTGASLINKTFPRIAQLSRQADLILMGPSTTCCPLYADLGVSQLAGVHCNRPQELREKISSGARKEILKDGTCQNIQILFD